MHQKEDVLKDDMQSLFCFQIDNSLQPSSKLSSTHSYVDDSLYVWVLRFWEALFS